MPAEIKKKSHKLDVAQKRAIALRIIKAFREQLGITTESEIANKLGLTHLQDLKNGRSSPEKHIRTASKLTELPLDWFYEDNDGAEGSSSPLSDPRLETLAEAIKNSSEANQSFAYRTIEMLTRELSAPEFIEVPVIGNKQVRDSMIRKVGGTADDISDHKGSDARSGRRGKAS